MKQSRKPLSLPLHADQYHRQRYMPALDGLRGVAVALVITCHLHNHMWNGVSGYVGVTIFFVLSGYLITRLSLIEERKQGRLNLSAFFVRRCFRILPLYYFFLGVYCLMLLKLKLWPDKIEPFFQSLSYYLLYLQEIPFWKGFAGRQGLPPFYHTWSLGIEGKFYLIWPLLFGLARVVSLPIARIVIAGIGMAICLVQGFLVEGTFSYSLQSYGFILMGAMIALILDRTKAYLSTQKCLQYALLPAITGMSLLQFYLMPYHPQRGLAILFAMSISILVGYVATSEGIVTRCFSWSPLTYLGRLSYGVYLCHILAIGLVERIASPTAGKSIGVLAYLGTIAVSICTSLLTFYTLEQPMIRIGHRFSRSFIESATHNKP